MTEQHSPPEQADPAVPEIGPYPPGPDHLGFAADEIDTSRAHPARMYDYFLGGWDNYEVDRVAGDRVIDLYPQVRDSVRANGAFRRRAVRAVAAAGVRQFLVLGIGIPTSPNPHEVARETAPESRVVYVDSDPIVATHARARLANAAGTAFALGDLRDPKAVLDDPAVRALIDFDRPVGLLIGGVMDFLSADDNPAGLLAAFGAALPAGSHLILSHGTYEPYEGYAQGRVDEAARTHVEEVYKSSTAPLTLRTKDEIAALLGPFTPLEPGVVRVPLWRPDEDVPGPEELNSIIFYGVVARKG
ncbi:SAM-dependent methyltransferase [Streptomyces sp. NRRL F-4489]|uniref:SAM-dependent methyltransferase n=1 Tax=Streptomyces sp. NRRL F-4489 TaxID=1609095 RepID=UPI00099EF721|nr:SAM-dependent methyltransferase [Streptomyces sp. NRRL F-4489]